MTKDQHQPLLPPGEPDNDLVICPQCVHQFRAIPVNVQKLLLASGHEPPFLARRSAPAPAGIKTARGTAEAIALGIDPTGPTYEPAAPSKVGEQLQNRLTLLEFGKRKVSESRRADGLERLARDAISEVHRLAAIIENQDGALDRAIACEAELRADAALLETAPRPWVVADGGSHGESRFRCMKQGMVEWTIDPEEALLFARRKDAEAFAAEDEDAWQILQIAALKEPSNGR